MPLRQVFEECEAVFLPTIKDGVLLTHERLILAIAQQIGSAHEDDGIDPDLVRLIGITIGGAPIYSRILQFDAELVLQIGERAIETAEKVHGYQRRKRKTRNGALGDVNLAIRAHPGETILATSTVLSQENPVAEAVLTISTRPSGVVFSIEKRGIEIESIEAPFPSDWRNGNGAVFTFSYSSSERQARTLTNAQKSEPIEFDVGWLDAREFQPPRFHDAAQRVFRMNDVALHERFLTQSECQEILALSSNCEELRSKTARVGPFPE